MYCAIDDIKNICTDADLIQLSNDDPAATVIDTTRVDGAIGNASETIDGYLRGRYNLPLSVTSKLLSKLAVDISIYELYRRRFTGTMPDQVKESYKTALKMLEQIQKGTISLGIESTGTVTPGLFQTNKTPEDRIFGKDTLKLY